MKSTRGRAAKKLPVSLHSSFDSFSWSAPSSSSSSSSSRNGRKVSDAVPEYIHHQWSQNALQRDTHDVQRFLAAKTTISN